MEEPHNLELQPKDIEGKNTYNYEVGFYMSKTKNLMVYLTYLHKQNVYFPLKHSKNYIGGY